MWMLSHGMDLFKRLPGPPHARKVGRKHLQTWP